MKRIPPAASIKALAMDLDGTILAPGALLNERTIKAIQKCIQRGLSIIINTGRSIESADNFRLPLGVEGPMVCFNGAIVADMPERKILNAVMLDTKAAEVCVDISRELGVHFQVYFLDDAHTEDIKNKGSKAPNITLITECNGDEREMYHKHTGILTELGDLKENLRKRGPNTCIKAMFLAEPEVQAKLRPLLKERAGENIYVAQTLRTFLEVMDASATKGQGLLFAIKHLGLKKEEVIAFGDEENDLPMFEAAGCSIAPSNAKDIVKDKADLVIGSNAEDGVAAFLENFFGL